MSETPETTQQNDEPNELLAEAREAVELSDAEKLNALKRKAELMGISYHPAIGLEKLRLKINTAINAEPGMIEHSLEAGIPNPAQQAADANLAEEYSAETLEEGFIASPVVLTPQQLRNESINACRKLVRVRVTCLNPNKRSWPGEVFTVSNSVVGTFSKFVPYNISEPYHLPAIILQALRERMCQVFINGRSTTGQPIKRAHNIPEFGIEVLPPLTTEEIRSLAQRQAMANGTQE